MKFCSQCGESVRIAIPEGDDRPRHLCDGCGTIHYQNPKVIVGCVPVWKDRVLLCKRSIEPRLGLWTLPAGFMENGESLEEGALRETREEALAEVTIVRLFAAFSLPHVDQAHLFYLARLIGPRFGAGAETEETRLFSRGDVPWNEIAFRAVEFALQKLFSPDGFSGLDSDQLPPSGAAHCGSYRRSPGDPWIVGENWTENEDES